MPESASGTRLTTSTGTITDNVGNAWKLGTGSAPNIQILENGVQVAGPLTGSQILYYNRIVYVQANDGNWYSWTDGAYSGGTGLSDPAVGGAIPIVPGAQGYGTTTRAAYGLAPGTTPTIYIVDTLLDNGRDVDLGGGVRRSTLRVALVATVPRVVVFEVSGYIDLGQSNITITYGYLFVAGQTAPAPGITIKNGGLEIFGGSHMCFQHFRIRPGDGGTVLVSTADHDAIVIYTSFGNPHDIVFDHLSVSWTGGKLINLDARISTANITIQNCLLYEALYRAANVTDDWAHGQPSSLAIPVVDHTGQVTIRRNVFAHNSGRHPEIHSGTRTHFFNNIVYDNGGDSNYYSWACLIYGVEVDPLFLDFVGNVIIGGPSALYPPLYALGAYYAPTGSQIYMTDNLLDSTRNEVQSYYQYAGLSFDPRQGAATSTLAGLTAIPSTNVKSALLTTVGARPLERDSADIRVVNEIGNYTGSIKTAPGTYPTLATNTRSLSLPSNPHTIDVSGYSNLELWIQGYTAVVEGTVTRVDPSFMKGRMSRQAMKRASYF